MAKWDRVTVRLTDGELLRLVAERVGGRIELNYHADDDEGILPDAEIHLAGHLTVTETSRNGDMLRELRIRRQDVVAVIRDRQGDETMPGDKPRGRRR